MQLEIQLGKIEQQTEELSVCEWELRRILKEAERLCAAPMFSREAFMPVGRLLKTCSARIFEQEHAMKAMQMVLTETAICIEETQQRIIERYQQECFHFKRGEIHRTVFQKTIPPELAQIRLQ